MTYKPGGPIVRKFPFAHNTAGILTGAALYTPTIGDILLDAWFEIDTAWDGTTPFGDIGIGAAFGTGLVAGTMSEAIHMHEPDNVVQGIRIGQNTGPLSAMFALANASTNDGGGAFVVSGAAVNLSTTPVSNGNRVLPAKFVTADPVEVVVSQDGTNTGAASGFDSSTPPPVLPLVVVTGTNDEYNFTLQRGTPAADLFTVAAGSYATTAALAVALNAAVDGAAHVFSATYGTWADDGSGHLKLTLLAAGANGSTVTAGTNDIVAGLGLSTATTTGGTGGDPGSTAGAGVLYLVTATPG